MERRIALDPIQGSRASSRVDLGYTEHSHSLVTSESFKTFVGVLGDSLEFHQANQGCFRVLLGTFDCCACNAGESGLISRRGGSLIVFLNCGVNLGFIFELRRGRPFKTRVFSETSGLLSSYDGYQRNLN